MSKDPNSLNTKPSTPPSRKPPPSSFHSFLQTSSHSGQKIEDTHQVLLCGKPAPVLTSSFNSRRAPEAGRWQKHQPLTHSVTSTIAALSVAEDLEAWESRPVTGVAMQTAAQLSLLWDPSHSAEIASYKSWQCTSESHCWYSTFFK